jgi:exodeoxyribonuclease-3
VITACRADVVVLQEATDRTVVAKLAQATGMEQYASRPGESLGFLSRRPVRRYGWYKPRISRHAFLEIEMADAGTRIFGVHLSAVHAAWTERRRIVELRALLKSVAVHQKGVHILTGDFNTLAPGELLDFTRLPGRLRALVWLSGGKVRWRTIQIVLDANYVDGFRLLHPDDPGRTFPASDPHVRLDFVFVPRRIESVLQSCEVITVPGVREASDHLPLLSVLEIPDEPLPASVVSAMATVDVDGAVGPDASDATP